MQCGIHPLSNLNIKDEKKAIVGFMWKEKCHDHNLGAQPTPKNSNKTIFFQTSKKLDVFFNGIGPNKRLEFNVTQESENCTLTWSGSVWKSNREAFPRLPSTFSLLGIVVPMCPTTLNQGLRIKSVQIVTSLNHLKGLEEYDTISGCI